jgi:Membrane protein involved in the export of O-antigen and teichoic acid
MSTPPSDPSSQPGAPEFWIRRVTGLLWRSRLILRLKPFDVSTEEGRSLERYRRIGLTTASGFAVRMITTVIGLVTVPLILGALGKSRYGLWSTITTLVAWVALFDLGLSNGLVNRLAKAYGKEDLEDANRYFTTAFVAMMGLAGLLVICLALTIPLLPWSSFLGVRGEVDNGTVVWSIAAALGAFVIAMPLAIVPQLFAAFQRSYLTNAFSLIGALVGFAVLILALAMNASMPFLVLAFSSGAVVASALGLVYALGGGFRWLKIRRRYISWTTLRSLMSLSVPMFLFQIGALAVNETQSIILARRCGLATVADFGIVMRLYLLTASLIQLGTGSFIPPLREAHERGDWLWVRTAFRRTLVIRLGIASVGAVTMIWLGNDILRVWLGRSDIAYGRHVWATLAVVQIASIWVSTHSELLWIMDRLWVLVGLVFANGAVTIYLTWYWAPRYGVLGAFLALGVVTILVNTWFVPLLGRGLLPARTVGVREKAPSP